MKTFAQLIIRRYCQAIDIEISSTEGVIPECSQLNAGMVYSNNDHYYMIIDVDRIIRHGVWSKMILWVQPMEQFMNDGKKDPALLQFDRLMNNLEEHLNEE